MNRVILKIDGMHCEGCCKRIKKVLDSVDFVKSVDVSLENNEAIVESDQDIDCEILKKKIEDIDLKCNL